MITAMQKEAHNRIDAILQVTGASQAAVVEAIENDSFHDFEDCLQLKCAEEVMEIIL